MSQRLLIIGGTSAIATAVARRYAARGARIGLVARREEANSALQADLSVRGATEVDGWALDANDIEEHSKVFDIALQRFGGWDHVLVAYGVLPDQGLCKTDVGAALDSFDTNARSVIALFTNLANRADLANRFEQQGNGVIAVISSPAGERGRASNYVYGAAKAAVTVFLSGLRHRLLASGVRVLTFCQVLLIPR